MCLQLVRKLLIAVTAAATDPQLTEEAKPFAHHMARHLAMLLAVGECSQHIWSETKHTNYDPSAVRL